MQTLQPKIRFPEFNGNISKYEKHLFEDIFMFSTGKNIKQKEASPEFENLCVRYGELYHMYNEVICISPLNNRTQL
jgi:type I restriction enzyme S subunit